MNGIIAQIRRALNFEVRFGDGESTQKAPKILRGMVFLFPALIFLLGSVLGQVKGANYDGINLSLYDKKTMIAICIFEFIVFLILIALYEALNYKEKSGKAVLFVLLVAIIFRLAAIALIPVLQASDFSIYYQLGQFVAQGDIQGAAEVLNEFGLNSLGGLALLNGALAFLSGGSALGFEISQAMVQCTSIYLVYKIGCLISQRVGYFAALFLALYPTNIVYVTVATNQHLSTMFMLLSIWALIRGLLCQSPSVGKTIRVGMLSGALLAVMYYCHPSTVPILAAVSTWIIYLFIRRPKTLLPCLIILASLLLAYRGTLTVGDAMMMRMGLTTQSSDVGSMLGKFVVGLNHETNGGLTSPYQGFDNEMDLLNHIPKDEVDQYCLEKIRERALDPRLPQLLVRKERIMWHSIDNAITWTEISVNEWADTYGMQDTQEYLTAMRICEGVKKADYWYLFLHYIAFSISSGIIIFLKNNIHNGCTIKKAREFAFLPMLIIDAWIVVFLLIEIQGRYRYSMMPFVFLISAVGVTQIVSIVLERTNKRKTLNKSENQ